MKNVDKHSLTINTLFFLFPLSVILGNLIININILLLCIFAFVFYYKKIQKFKINLFDKIILIFFLYTLVTLFINFVDYNLRGITLPEFIISKTFLYLRYLVLYLILRILISQKILRIDWFSYACACCAIFVCLDIFIQYSFGKNIFGLEPVSPRQYTGVFGSEWIAGGYLQKFALFSFFFPFILKKKIFYRVTIQFIFFFIFTLGIILSGNRMPLILFLFSFFVMFLLNKELRKYFFLFLIITSLGIIVVHKVSSNFRLNIGSFYANGKILINTTFTKDLSEYPAEVWEKPYVSEFACFRYIFKKNPFFGGGVRYFRTALQAHMYNDDLSFELANEMGYVKKLNPKNVLPIHVSGDKGCSTHPHNYYFEILTDLGLLGLIIILYFVFMLLRKILFKNNAFLQFNLLNLDNKIAPFFLFFFI